jgi:hypothetical protein
MQWDKSGATFCRKEIFWGAEGSGMEGYFTKRNWFDWFIFGCHPINQTV